MCDHIFFIAATYYFCMLFFCEVTLYNVVMLYHFLCDILIVGMCDMFEEIFFLMYNILFLFSGLQSLMIEGPSPIQTPNANFDSEYILYAGTNFDSRISKLTWFYQVFNFNCILFLYPLHNSKLNYQHRQNSWPLRLNPKRLWLYNLGGF